MPAVHASIDGLLGEAAAVAKAIGASHLKNVDDTYPDLARSVLLNPLVLLALAVAALLALVSLRFKDQPLPKPVRPTLPPPTGTGEGRS